jgi:hypothetical protein
VRACGICKCFVAPKAAIASEECPLEGAEKRWGQWSLAHKEGPGVQGMRRGALGEGRG